MKIRWILLLLVYACSAAQAIQPVEAGLHPVYERLKTLHAEQRLLNERLRAHDTLLEDRVGAYRTWKALELERQNLEALIREARKLADSPFVTFISSPEAGR